MVEHLLETKTKGIKDGEYSENSEWICGLVNHKRGNKDKPREFEVWRDYLHYASKTGGLKKGFDKLALKILKNTFL